MFAALIREEPTHVRPDRQDRARHRRDRRHRRRHRARAARAGRDGRHFRARGARRSMRSPASLASAPTCCPAISPTRRRSRRWLPTPRSRDGQLDILVNNAGITRTTCFRALKDEDWEQVLNVNLTSTFRLARAAVKRHDAPPLRPHHRHHLGGRRHRQSRAGQLHRRQGRHDRHDEVARPGIRQARRDRELRRAGLHRDGR